MHGLIPLALCISGFQHTLKTANILNHVRSDEINGKICIRNNTKTFFLRLKFSEA